MSASFYLMATKSTEEHGRTRKYKFLSNNFFVFFRGFRGNNFYLYQVKEVLAYFSTRKRVP